MTIFIALLCAVNVGGTGKLAMGDLKDLCEKAGFTNVRTYIASGNVVFESNLTEVKAHAKLHAALKVHTGKAIGVHIRSAKEMAEILKANPFTDAAPNHTVAIFMEDAPSKDTLAAISGKAADEEVRLGSREIYVFYGSGMGRTKLKIPAAKGGTARNMNTIAKLVQMAGAS